MSDRFEPPRPRAGDRLDVFAHRTPDGAIVTDSLIGTASERPAKMRWPLLAGIIGETPDLVSWYCKCAAKVLPNGDVQSWVPCDRHRRKAERDGLT